MSLKQERNKTVNILIVWISQFLNRNGGMEKVFVHFANEMVKRGHKVALAYCTENSGRSYFQLDSRVNAVNIANYLPNGKWESHKNIFFKVKRECLRLFSKSHMLQYTDRSKMEYLAPGIKKLLGGVSPDIIISMDVMTTTAMKWVDVSNRYPLVTMSHFNAEQILKDITPLEKQMVIKSNALQVLMPHDLKIFHADSCNVPLVHIPNIVPQYEVDFKSKGTQYKIVDVARLSKKQKRQHLLIEAFAKIAHKYPKWKVELWGEEQGGVNYSKYLHSLIQKYHLENQVFLMGNTKKVIDVYKNADIFAFPSAFEGFGLAMTEAMSAGLPVIAYQSCPAVNELIRNKKNGILVKDGIDAFALGLEWVITHKTERLAMGKQAQQDMKQYSAEKIWNQWELLMHDIVIRKGKV